MIQVNTAEIITIQVITLHMTQGHDTQTNSLYTLSLVKFGDLTTNALCLGCVQLAVNYYYV